MSQLRRAVALAALIAPAELADDAGENGAAGARGDL